MIPNPEERPENPRCPECGQQMAETQLRKGLAARGWRVMRDPEWYECRNIMCGSCAITGDALVEELREKVEKLRRQRLSLRQVLNLVESVGTVPSVTIDDVKKSAKAALYFSREE